MWRWCKRLAILILPLLVVVAGVGFMLIRAEALASLPIRAGTIAVAGVSAPVTVSRDALGVPRIRAATLADACFAQGFLHAQDRYVQMDVMRRYAAGRLAELFGTAMVENDRRMRPHAFERRADDVLKRLPERHRVLLSAYAAGVNEGLRRLRAAPPEYALLRVAPKPWSERDALLLQYTMWDMLAMNRGFELMLGTMREALSESAIRFLTPEASRFDVVEPGPGWTVPPVPGPGEITIPQARSSASPRRPEPARPSFSEIEFARALSPAHDELFAIGSNAWAVSGGRSTTGGAILANDMHLPLRVPAMWYRVSLAWSDGPTPSASTSASSAAAGRLDGFSLPGVPGIVVGGNAVVAWGFTNVEGDFEDWVVIETDPADPNRYKVPGGTEEFTRVVEQIDVRGGASQRLEVRQTRWGPVARADATGRPLVARWIAHEDEHTNLNLFDIFTADTIEKAVDAAASWHGPPQNTVIASADGRIAWTASGLFPVRSGFDGSFPVSWARAGVGWTSWLADADRPRVIDPPSGVIVTANHRTLPVERARKFGRAWASPARAARITELLAASPKHDEKSLLAIQLDTGRATMNFYRDLALEACRTDEAGTLENKGEIERLLKDWNGTADAEQRGFALLKRFRAQLMARAFKAFTAPCEKIDPGFRYRWFNDEEPLRTLLEKRPAHLLPRVSEAASGDVASAGESDASWESLIRSCLARAVNDLEATSAKLGLATTWGDLNRANVSHPLSSALGRIPGVRSLLDMPSVPLSGDGLSVRAQTSEFGASQRLVISPGHEESAIAQLPGGQSGHFLSPHYRDQFNAWVRGEPTPLLPGQTVWTMTLTPVK
ncbi:MAG: penicillin acylase family protein [Phycisphaerales bacterium]